MGSEAALTTKAEPTSSTWEHPRAELREELRRRPAAWVAVLHGATMDPLLVARIPAVHRKLTAAGVPHVLPLVAVERDGERLLLVHRHEEGESLAHRLARGRLPVARALAILRSICRCLSAAHRLGIEHRALGPASVLLGPHDQLWLVDFALADLFDESCEDLDVDGPDIALHPMTPERARCEEGSAAEDVYLVGCLAYWMIAGVPPFAAVDLPELARRHATEEPRPLTELAAEPVSFTLVDAVARALAKDPEHRFADIDELDRALAHAQLEAGVGELRDAPRVHMLPPRTTNPFGTDPPRPMPRELAIKLERLSPTVMIEPKDRAHMPAAPSLGEPDEITATLSLPSRKRTHVRSALILLGVAAGLAILLAPLHNIEPPEVRWSGVVRERPVDDGARARPVVPDMPALPTRAADVAPTPPPAIVEPPPIVEAPIVEAPPAIAEPTPAATAAPVVVARTSEPKRAAAPAQRDARAEAPAEPPAHERAECERTRKIADDAREGHDWKGLLAAASRPACWAARSDAQLLRVKALMELGQFAECASAVDRMNAPRGELARMGELCRRRAAPG